MPLLYTWPWCVLELPYSPLLAPCPLTCAGSSLAIAHIAIMEDKIMIASDHQPTRSSPPVDDIPRTQVAQWRADGQTDDDESGADRRSGDDSRRPASVQSSFLSTPDADRFPIEVFENIIDRMDNQYTLYQATQVCAAWYPRAMRNLYYTIHIRRRRSFDMLSTQLRASPRVKQWLATTRELRVADDDFGGGGRNPRFLDAVPPALGRAMSRVQRLAINRLHRDVHMTFFPALSQFSSIESLELSWRSLNLSQLRRIIYKFPRLTTLALIDITDTQHSTVSSVGVTSFRPPSDIHLRRLSIKNTLSGKTKVIDWIAQSGLCISLEDLTVCVDCKSSREGNNISALLKAAGSSLTRLQCHYIHGDLVQNTALRSLDLVFHLSEAVERVGSLDSDGSLYAILEDQLYGVLSTVRSHQLEHIEITTSVHRSLWGFSSLIAAVKSAVMYANSPGSRALHKVMSQPRFNALKNVKVTIQTQHKTLDMKLADSKDLDRAVFRQLLRPWSDRGIIKRVNAAYTHTCASCFA
ncbi:uncharacterized protein B0H18DRAFT_445285 [Fomitopsis serialis]|uniref:uncharacterized protein n=1 Tax=Fomitopsis serialis TaxID=139415 RepID=UPI00200753FD|nr:uncharacterized protein B0H18DRAFT_445285 [Neoantrodia serialis]KAH9924062.1 hypothetical protein B0H18DRAFT_445285 [Neoantrodia serialis]